MSSTRASKRRKSTTADEDSDESTTINNPNAVEGNSSTRTRKLSAKKNTSSRELTPVVNQKEEEDIQNISIFDSSWDTLYENYLDDKTDDEMIQILVEQFSFFGLPKTRKEPLIEFLNIMRQEYNSNIYHNFQHACHVTLNCAYFLSQLSQPEDFSVIEKLSLLFAAVMHDAGHLGVSNYALINKNHNLAKKYHDQSVAEMHSLTLGLEALRHGDHPAIGCFSHEERRQLRKCIIELVLGTDIADPYKKKILYDRVDDLSNGETGELNVEGIDGKTALLILILRASDVGSSMQSIQASQIWAKRFYLETTVASYVGDAPHIEPGHCHVTQINYFERHSQFLVKKLIRTNGLDDIFTTRLLHNVDANIQAWKKTGFELINQWDNDDVLISAKEQLQTSQRGKEIKPISKEKGRTTRGK